MSFTDRMEADAECKQAYQQAAWEEGFQGVALGTSKTFSTLESGRNVAKSLDS